MILRVPSPPLIIDTEDVGFEQGAHILVKQALATLPIGGSVGVRGRHPNLLMHLRAWSRTHGHGLVPVESTSDVVAWVVRGSADVGRWRGSVRAGGAQAADPGAIVERAESTWGLAARGARVEAGGPAFSFPLDTRAKVWTDEAPRLYAIGAASQWDPATAIDWEARFELPPVVETAVVQIMTFLVENEHAALLIPAHFLSTIHPHFREVMQVLALQVADEARHVEVFTRRALLHGGDMGISTAGGQASLRTLLEEPDFALSSFMLSVLGEGTFLSLLAFLEALAPDPVTRRIAHLALQDESRHVAFGIAHLRQQVDHDVTLRERLSSAVERRHDALAQTSGLNDEVFDALVLIGSPDHSANGIATGWNRVQRLQEDMDKGRRRRLLQLGFSTQDAARLSSLHTRNFM